MKRCGVFRGYRRAVVTRGGRSVGLPVAGPGKAFGFGLLLAAWALAGCMGQDKKLSGGDDFPNAVETLGKAAADEASDTASWNAYDEAPATPPEAYDDDKAPDMPPQDGLPKGAAVGAQGRIIPGFEIAGAVRNLFLFLDSVTGLTRAIRVQTLADVVVRDTTFYRLELVPPLVRMMRMSGEVAYAGRVERFSYEDADGDGVLSPVGAQSRARLIFAVEHDSGLVELRSVVIGAGADGSFEASADNIVWSREAWTLSGTDTVYNLTIVPVPGDSVVRDPQRAYTTVDVRHMVKAGGTRIAQSYRARLHADSSRNRALRFRRTVTTAAGVTETVALGRDSVADFAPGDTGFVRVAFTAADSAGEGLVSAQAVYRVALADSSSGFENNRLLRLEREKRFGAGPESGRRFRFVPSGTSGEGEVDLRVDWRAGGWIGFAGSVSATGFLGVWADDAGQSGPVRYDAGGAVATGAAP